MTYVVSLTEFTPEPRFGTNPGPWIQVRFEESLVRNGPWSAIETQALDPVDTDPLNPQSRDLTTELVQNYPTWIRVVFIDAPGNQGPTEPVFVGSAVRPSVQEVANLMPDRTTLPRTAGGGDAGTFNADTTPTAAQVEDLIDSVLDTVEAQVTEHAPARVLRCARTLVKFQAAMLVEVTYFSHQGEPSTSRLDVWRGIVERHTEILQGAQEGTQDVGVA